MASPRGSVTIAATGRRPARGEARDAVALRDRGRERRTRRGTGGGLVAPRDARDADRAERALPRPGRGAGRLARRAGEPAAAPGGGAVAGAGSGGAAARRRLPVSAGRCGLRRSGALAAAGLARRSEEHTSELQSRRDLVCRLLLEKKKKKKTR